MCLLCISQYNIFLHHENYVFRILRCQYLVHFIVNIAKERRVYIVRCITCIEKPKPLNHLFILCHFAVLLQFKLFHWRNSNGT